tara:strand:- start:10169 stop:10708 length:540 start_codon:yes stop_codon:yes gene_type:complete
MNSKVDAIIVLGCEFKNNNLGKESKSRVKQGIKLYKKGLSKNLVLAGGTKRKKYLSYYMKQYARKLGIPTKNLFTEELSKDTIGNALFTKPIIKKQKWKNLILVTSDYHLERSLYIFHQVYGNNYTILGEDSKTSLLSKLKRFKTEKEYTLFAETLFSKIKPGNDKEIKNRLLRTPKYL